MDFIEFAHHYVNVPNPTHGVVHLELWPDQLQLFQDLRTHRFVIVKKYRQGGFSTKGLVYAMWAAMFRENQTVAIISPNDRDSVAACEFVNQTMNLLPFWLRPHRELVTKDRITLGTSGSKILFNIPSSAYCPNLDFLFIDEAAFNKDVDRLWDVVYPCLRPKARCLVVSTTNGPGWFMETWLAATRGSNQFHATETDYRHCPYWQDEAKNAEMRQRLGEAGWMQEVEALFLGENDQEINSDKELG